MNPPQVQEPPATLASSSGFDEETARAELYGLLAALYYAAPAASLLEQLRVAATTAPVAGGFLEDAWHDLVASSRALSDLSIQNEYNTLFGGVGKPEVYLFGSHYMSGFLNEKPLARLRTALEALGLSRVEAMSETEDHFAYLCEVMRYLIAGEDVSVSNLTQQLQFFSVQMQPWVSKMCEAIEQHPKAIFYKHLAKFTHAFVSVETQAFDMLG
jgi:TorA maturation chaperone TorD